MSGHLRPARAVAPGNIIAAEIEARGWTQKDLAAVMGRPLQAINEIIRGRKQITAESAWQLAAAFGTSAEFWLNLETNYQLHLSRREAEENKIARRSRIYSIVPVTEMLKRGWITTVQPVDALEREICAFLEVSSLDEQPRLVASFRQTQQREADQAAQTVWIKQVERIARSRSLPRYEPGALVDAVPEILSCAAEPGDVNRIPAIMHSLGVHFVIVRHLPRTYIDGATFSLDQAPVVALSLRYDRIDSFWFTFMHELAHLATGHPDAHLEDTEAQHTDKGEIEANTLAGSWLIDPGAFETFVEATRPYFSEKKIVAFANGIGRCPGIILGRLHHEELVAYQSMRRLLVKVRPYLAGWIDSTGSM
jgi:HTH-type transcriptional regulator/antitoxin HigA